MRDQQPAFDPLTWREDYDWREAFTYAGTIRTATNCDKAPFGMDDVAEVVKAENGENDGPSWIMVGKLKDGRYFFLDAGCDYTGWDCQAGGDAQVADTLDGLIRFGMDESARERFGYKLPEIEA
jgi:hypothetical protein